MPRLRPAWSFGLVLVGLYVVSDFGAVAVLDCEVLTWELYKARGGRDAIVLAFGLVLVVIPLLLGVRWLHGDQVAERGRVERPPSRIKLGRWSVALTSGIYLVMIGIGVLMPAISLGTWLWSGWVHQVDFAPVFGPAVETVALAALGALLVVVGALAPAWITARTEGKRSAFLEGAIHLTSSIPGILVAVGILQLIIGLKRTVPLELGEISAWSLLEGAGVFLFAGYLMRFLSQSYAAIKPAILRLDRSQEEAALGLGASAWRRFKTIIMPAIRPGLLAGYTLVFLSTAKSTHHPHADSPRSFDTGLSGVRCPDGDRSLMSALQEGAMDRLALQFRLIRWNEMSNAHSTK